MTQRQKRQWADQYGSRWYLHYDGRPPHDEDQDYYWNGTQWVSEDEREKDYEHGKQINSYKLS